MNELEYSVLGGLMLEPSLIMDIDTIPDDFESEVNRNIFSEIMRLSRDGEAVDIVTVSEAMHKATGKNYLPTLGAMCKSCMSTKNVTVYARMLRQQAQERKAVEIAKTLVGSVNRDGATAISEAIRGLMNLSATRKDFDCSIKDAIAGAVEVIDEAFNRGGELIGISTGIEKIDSALGGFQRSDLYVIGARPAMGKTAFLLNLASNANGSSGIISSEQGRDQVGVRMLSINGRVSTYAMRTGKLSDTDWPRITGAVGDLSSRQIRINDKPSPTLDEIINQARKWKFNYGLEILFIDYLQRIKVDLSKKRHEAVGEVARGLKELARELDIPIVTLAQVSRSVESRPNKRPGMADLSDSSEIEKEADVIITLYRDEVYDENSADKGIAELSILKNRHGPVGTIRTVWRSEYMRFEDFASQRDF